MDQGPTNRFNNAVAQLIYGTFGNKKYDSHNLYAVQIYANNMKRMSTIIRQMYSRMKYLQWNNEMQKYTFSSDST